MRKNDIYLKKILLSLGIFCLFQTVLFSQKNIIRGQLKDVLSQREIPYATIQNLTKQNGVFADSLGVFEMEIQQFPTTLFFSSIGYQNDTITLINATESTIFYLKKDENQLPTVEIIARQKLQMINDAQYFPHNFVLWKDYAFLLSKKGTFGDFRIEVFDKNGDLFKTHNLDLGRIEDIKINCLDQFFLVNKNYSINLEYENGQFIPLSQMLNTDYETLFANCICQDKNRLFYEFKQTNNLVKKYIEADKKTGESHLFKEIREADRLENYAQDLWLMNEGATIANTGDIGAVENKRIRNLQNQGDFLENIFHRNFAKNYLFLIREKLVLFNHEEGKIEFFGTEQYSKPMTFVTDKSYSGLILFDAETEKFYAGFRENAGLNLKAINLKTGLTEDDFFLEIASFQKISVRNNVIFILGTREGNSFENNEAFFIKKMD